MGDQTPVHTNHHTLLIHKITLCSNQTVTQHSLCHMLVFSNPCPLTHLTMVMEDRTLEYHVPPFSYHLAQHQAGHREEGVVKMGKVWLLLTHTKRFVTI